MSNDNIIDFPHTHYRDPDVYWTRLNYVIRDWGSHNHVVLTSETWSVRNGSPSYKDIVQYNFQTSESKIIMQNIRRNLHMLDINVDGSKILMSFSPVREYTQLISVYDMVTGEEIILPITGIHPQWVD